MSNNASAPTTNFMTCCHNDDAGKLILRLTIGGLLLFHGVHKLQHGVSGMVDMISARGLPGFMAYGAYIGEVVAPILIIIGLFTRPAGLVVAFTLIMAIYIVHMGQLTQLGAEGGYALELQMLYLLGGLAIVFLGAGKFRITKSFGMWN